MEHDKRKRIKTQIVPNYVYLGLTFLVALWFWEASLLPAPWKEDSIAPALIFEGEKGEQNVALRRGGRKRNDAQVVKRHPEDSNSKPNLRQPPDPRSHILKQTRAKRAKHQSISKGFIALTAGQGNEGPFLCDQGAKSIPLQWVDDDFCDCEDGTDEPNTAACSSRRAFGQLFLCQVAKDTPVPALAHQKVFNSRINDGICDCCDGSDEFEHPTLCPNECASLVQKFEKEQLLFQKGRRIRDSSYANPSLNGVTKEQKAVGGGTDNAFFHLIGKCFHHSSEGFEYRFCPFKLLTQKEQHGRHNEVQLGIHSRWEEMDHVLQMTEGTSCGEMSRSARINFNCGLIDEILQVVEYEMCNYSLQFQTPAACVDDLS